MSDLSPQLLVQPILPGAGEWVQPGHDHQSLWFALAKRQLASVILVPADVGTPVAGLAESLADVGRRLGDSPVTAIVAESIDYAFATRTAALLASTKKRTDALPGSSPLEVIVAIHPVTTEPLGLALVQAASAVVLCIGLGRTRLRDAQETIDLVGRERIVGCVTIG